MLELKASNLLHARNKTKCPANVAAMFNDVGPRSQLWSDWWYNGHDVQKLDILYKKVKFYKKVSIIRFDLDS